MKIDLIKNQKEIIILSLLKEKDMYGYQIKKLLDSSNHVVDIKKITLYKALERMEKLLLIDSYYKDDDTTKGGKRKYFKITSNGLSRLNNASISDNFSRVIKSIIDDKHSFIGRDIIHLNEVTSTNDYAKEIAESCVNGTVITARNQTKGKGRLGRKWLNSKGQDLMLSIVLKDDLSINEIGKMSQLCAASVFETLKDYGIKTKIKWPNDLLVNDKKICGILIESKISSKIEYLILGIGLNINSTYFNDVSSKAISMRTILNKELSIDEVLDKLLIKFNNLYDDLCIGGNMFLNICKNNSYLAGKKININSKEFRVIDITNNGQIILEDENKNQEIYHSGEITLEDIY